MQTSSDIVSPPVSRDSRRSGEAAGSARVGRAGRRPTGPADRAPTGRPGRGPAGPAGPSPQARATLHELVAGFACALLEVEAGRRSRRQLSRVVSPELAARLAPVPHHPGPVGRVVRVRGSRTARNRYEAVALVARHGRVGALAIVLARRSGEWRVVEVVRPEEVGRHG